MANKIDTRLVPSEVVERFMAHIEKDHKELAEILRENGSFSSHGVSEIIETPFEDLRKDLDENKLYVHRRKFLGTFYSTVNKAKAHLNRMEKHRALSEEGLRKPVPDKKFNEIKNMLNDFITRKH